MAKSDSTDPVLDFESEGAPVQVDPATSEIPVADNPVGPEAETPEAAPVKLEENPDFDKGDGDVYVSVAEVPEEYRVSPEDDRFKVGSHDEVPPALAAQLQESAVYAPVEEPAK